MREMNDVDPSGAIIGEFEEKLGDFFSEPPEDF